jgi:predicted hotdog family 3-hydroxylacyl-ACP dehydratase
MVLLDEVVAWRDRTATCRVTIREDSPLVEGT